MSVDRSTSVDVADEHKEFQLGLKAIQHIVTQSYRWQKMSQDGRGRRRYRTLSREKLRVQWRLNTGAETRQCSWRRVSQEFACLTTWKPSTRRHGNWVALLPGLTEGMQEHSASNHETPRASRRVSTTTANAERAAKNERTAGTSTWRHTGTGKTLLRPIVGLNTKKL